MKDKVIYIIKEFLEYFKENFISNTEGINIISVILTLVIFFVLLRHNIYLASQSLEYFGFVWIFVFSIVFIVLFHIISLMFFYIKDEINSDIEYFERNNKYIKINKGN